MLRKNFIIVLFFVMLSIPIVSLGIISEVMITN